MTAPEILLRLCVAALATALLGLERSRRHQFIGARTFGLIGIGGAAAAILAVRMDATDPAAVSRVLQGMLAGIGFLGAGVIVHPGPRLLTVGVTTAASIWVAAVLGFAAGFGEWILVAGAVALALLLLVIPEPLASQADRDRAKQEREAD